MRAMLYGGLVALLALLQAPSAIAQSDPLDPVPGGATAQTAVCIQYGDLNSGAFAGIMWKSPEGTWLVKRNAADRIGRRPGVFDEIARDENSIEVLDKSRQILYQVSFDRKKIKSSNTNPAKAWRDTFHLLSAADQESAADCIALGQRLAAGGQGGDAAKLRQEGGATVVFITVKPGSPNSVKPGTKLTATSGPPCPNQPGFFLCPNKFSCAPDGGVCCPGAGACKAGTFCDRFIPNSCISPASASFCQGTENPATGTALHCAPGSQCLPGNFCDP